MSIHSCIYDKIKNSGKQDNLAFKSTTIETRINRIPSVFQLSTTILLRFEREPKQQKSY